MRLCRSLLGGQNPPLLVGAPRLLLHRQLGPLAQRRQRRRGGGGGGDDGETSGEKKNEGHFVCIFAISDTVLYVDSYGGKPKQEHVLRFLRLCNREAMYNKRQVQDYGSSYCGLFALFFLLFLAKRPRLAINFFSQKKRLRNNDRLCLRYLLQMV
jgi:hypothetical protein